jgi:hypothetical protein
MALFGSDRSVMPTFKTSPEPDNSARSPYDDLNRVERNDRNDDRNSDRASARQADRTDERNAADIRAQERLDRTPDRNGREPDRNSDQRTERSSDREPEQVRAKTAQQPSRRNADAADPLIEGLFSKLPEPSTEWPLPARQKWLQTAANIFDLMYAPGEADAGELAIRVERTSTR